MNNIALNQYQLAQIKQFLRDKTKHEEDVLDELLDHFACKVEEFIEKDSYLIMQTKLQTQE